jgi:hypothetical protein
MVMEDTYNVNEIQLIPFFFFQNFKIFIIILFPYFMFIINTLTIKIIEGQIFKLISICYLLVTAVNGDLILISVPLNHPL